MKKVLLLLAAVSVLWIYQSTDNEASAHGGTYRGPAGEVPPGQRDPKDPQPPPEPPGAGTNPPTGGPGTNPDPGTGSGDPGEGNPPPDSGGPPAPPPPAPVGPSVPGGATTPGQGRRAGPPPMSFDNWLFWWAYNKDEILNIKAALKRNANTADSRTSPFFFGGGESGSGSEAPTTEMINNDIVPALEMVVGNKEMHPDIRGGALIALSRCRGPQHLATFFRIGRDESEEKIVQESAILALGIGQYKTPEVRDYLIRIIDDTKYPYRGRCFAMMCLGMLQDNDEAVVACLKRRLDGSESVVDVAPSALLTLGLLHDNKLVPELLEWLESNRAGRTGMKFGDLERAWLVAALGKIGDPQALKAVTDVLKEKGQLTVRSAMIAVGQLLPEADEKTQSSFVRTFAQVVEKESDQTAKNFGMIALGRIGGADDASEEVRGLCRKILEKSFIDGNKVTERPYASLAIGLLGFGEKKPQEMRYELAEMIRKELAELRGDKTALGAQAIALGMLGDRRDKTVELLIQILQDRGQDKKLRGAAAMALGLVQDRSANEAIMKALEEREDRDLRVDTAVAAGLLGDRSAVTKLVNVLADPKASQFVLGSVALALGQIGDKTAVKHLIRILEPEKAQQSTYPDLTRALVAVALGQIADQSDIRVLSQISKDINYRASFPSLDEILTIL